MKTVPAIHQLSTIQLADCIRSGELTAEDTMAHYLERIRKHDRDLGAFTYVDYEQALENARMSDITRKSGQLAGPLAGVPFAVKDFSHVRGIPTSEGTRAFGADFVPDADEPMVVRLRAAGAIPVGKTNVPEFGLHSATYNERFGITRNPWHLARTPGGSSGGSSAAVSAGLVSFATGSDGGGSIRTPAAYCGLVGLKTTTALVPRHNGRSDLSCLGYLTRTVADTARLLDVSAGAHPGDRRSVNPSGGPFETSIQAMDVRGLKACWSADFGYAPMEAEVVSIAFAAFRRLIEHAELEEVSEPVRFRNVYREWAIDQLNFLKDELDILGADLTQLDKRSQHLLETFSKSEPVEHIRAQAAFDELEQQLAEAFTRTDVIATPSTACLPFGAGEEIPDTIAGRDATWTGAEPLSMFANIAGIPAISIPAGITKSGLPVGLQLASTRFADARLLRLAALLEDCAPWPALAPAYSGDLS